MEKAPQVEQKVEIPTSNLTGNDISLAGKHFVDQHGRILYLRGANVSASSKVPLSPSGKIDEHRNVSYVGRPFPLEDAPGHWERLRRWGLTFVRITVTWDAIEHAGPGQYDMEYLEYLRKLLVSMEEYGLVCYVAIHQDVWSRYSGGSGAPGWTLESAGFDLSNDGEKLALSGAAFLDGIKGGRLAGERGLWPTGYQKLAAATMNTLFWGGQTFAPGLTVPTANGKKNIQIFLQDAFLGAVGKLAEAVGDVSSVMGIELMNEPHPGFIGLPSIHEWNYNTDLHLGDFPSPLQSFAMGSGHPTKIPHYTRSFPFPTRQSHHVTGNAQGVSAWEKECPWEKEGVWRWSDQQSKPVALQENYFSKIKGKDGKTRATDFYTDFYWPFVKKWESVIAKSKLGAGMSKGKGKMRMVEVVPNEFCPVWPEDARPQNLVYAPHWYDLNALFKKQMGTMTVNVQGLSRGMFVLKALYFGRSGVMQNYALQIRNIVKEARGQLGDVPIVFGECGVPLDLNREQALKTGDWQWQERMMDAMISAFESSLVSYNLWNYNPANRDDLGDDWNAENFSFYSDDNRSKGLKASTANGKDTDAGGRLLDAIVRPYAIATAGTPSSLAYDTQTAMFAYFFSSPIYMIEKGDDPTRIPSTAEITEIFLPKRTYTSVASIGYYVSPGGRIVFDLENSRAFVWFRDEPPEWTYGKPLPTVRNRGVKIWVRDRTQVETKFFSTELVILSLLVLLAGVYLYDPNLALKLFGAGKRLEWID